MMRTHLIAAAALVVVVGGAAGCGTSLQVNLLQASAQKPSNVALYFTVDTSKGEPVGGLTSEQFKIYEDGKPVSIYESQQTILNPEVAVVHYTMLLVDLSASVSESGHLEAIAPAADSFAQRVAKIHQVGIYGFDGSREIKRITPFSSSEGSVRSGLHGIKSFKGKDPSTNLNGAIVEAIKELQKTRDASKVPLRFATLVVFTDGTDRSHYVTGEEVSKAIDEADVDVYTIGLGGEVDQKELGRLGKSGSAFAENDQKVTQAFDDIAAKIEGYAKRFYLLSYCSPARNGKHVLAVEAEANGARGAAEYEFDATGFGPKCDPNQKPNFAVSGLSSVRAGKGGAAAPAKKR
jgi:hypothetical protein